MQTATFPLAPWSKFPMSTTTTGPALLLRPALPTFEAPSGMPGAVEIEGVPYGLAYVASKPLKRAPSQLLGYRLLKGDGTTYDLDATTLECDCPHTTHRGLPCKHTNGVRDLIAAGKIAGSVSTPAASEEF